MTIVKSSETDTPVNEYKWPVWQWLVIIALVLAIFITLYIKLAPVKESKMPPGYQNITLTEEIEGYRKQLAGNKENFVALSRLANAYVRQARFTGDPAWYLLAEQN